MLEVICLQKDIIFQYKYMITFIIPSIGRSSLHRTLESLLHQNCKEWKAVVIFDGVKNNCSTKDERISFVEIEKTDCVLNQASTVRNSGLQYVNTEWVGFVDDDDTIAKDYVECFHDECKRFMFDIYIYRMVNKDHKIFPSLTSKSIIPCDVGISFMVRKEICVENPFVNSHCEDYDFLKNMMDMKKKIIISSYVKYFVKSIEDEYEPFSFDDSYNIFLNGYNPYLYKEIFMSLSM